MRFNEWTVSQLIEYLQLAKCGMDYKCHLMCSGEVHIYNGERKDGEPQSTIDDLVIEEVAGDV